jgi:ketosteroid isomerase-like protein
MSQQNVDCASRMYSALNRRDKEALLREVHPEVEGAIYFMQTEGTVYRGLSGVGRLFDEIFGAFPDWHADVEIAEHGEAVVSELRMTGTSADSRLPLDQTGWQALKFRDGKIVWFHGYGSRTGALEAAGLSE